MTNNELAAYIDHTLLKPEATAAQIATLCDEAKKYIFKTVCVNPGRVSRAAEALAGSGVGITTVVGFPLGATTGATKAFEAAEAIKNGATEVDMVINIGALKDGDNETVREDIATVKDACGNTPLKVILETCLLTDSEIETACKLSVEAKADFVKTSTGFSTAGSNPHVVALMRKTVGPDTGVKASGGVRSREDAMKIIEAGATRIGTSSGVKILEGEAVSGGY